MKPRAAAITDPAALQEESQLRADQIHPPSLAASMEHAPVLRSSAQSEASKQLPDTEVERFNDCLAPRCALSAEDCKWPGIGVPRDPLSGRSDD